MDKVYHIIENTAWMMNPPQLFGGFHMMALAVTVAMAILLALFVVRYISRDNTLQIEDALVRTLSFSGWFLVIIEIYKQLFVYHIILNDSYDWWFFPFQLCSIPMYLCILLPLTRGRLRTSILIFLETYTLVSAVAALIFPEDYLRPYITLTLHGFVWHGMLLFISLCIIFSHAKVTKDIASRSPIDESYMVFSSHGFAYATLMFITFSIIAICFNALTDSYMFYMSPLHISPQPVVSSVQKRIGIPYGLGLYMGAIILGAYITRTIIRHLHHKYTRTFTHI